MKITQWISLSFFCVSLLTLTACTTKHKMQDDMAISDANSAYSNDHGVQTSGLGDESNFGDDPSSRRHLASQRTYYFDFDSDVVHDADKPAILANAQKLSSRTATKAMLEGHTDPRGSREYNIGLGERRAKSVAQILTHHGVKRHQIRIVSYGAEKLASSGHTETAYQLDRRSVLNYLQ